MTRDNHEAPLAPQSARPDVAEFLEAARKAPAPAAGNRGRLIFALDATMSRQPTWDTACKLQGEMFREAGSIGGLDVQLVYFRGLNECRSSRWVSGEIAALDQFGSWHTVGAIPVATYPRGTAVRAGSRHARTRENRHSRRLGDEFRIAILMVRRRHGRFDHPMRYNRPRWAKPDSLGGLGLWP